MKPCANTGDSHIGFLTEAIRLLSGQAGYPYGALPPRADRLAVLVYANTINHNDDFWASLPPLLRHGKSIVDTAHLRQRMIATVHQCTR